MKSKVGREPQYRLFNRSRQEESVAIVLESVAIVVESVAIVVVHVVPR
jgi:hypothetical protein